MSSLVHLGRAAADGAQLMPRPAVQPLPGALVEARSTTRRNLTAADLMTRLPSTVHHSDSMWRAWDLLHRARLRHLVVVDDHHRPLGVLDDRTVALEWPPGPMNPHRTPVHTLLRGRARPRVGAGDDVATVARTMLSAQADAVPVVGRDGRLFGLVTLWHFAELAAGTGEEGPPSGSTAGTTGEG
ncbi:CBS domain-containing protein [Geodermatophilus sp. URMC 64]